MSEGGVALALFGGVFALMVYFLPTIIAGGRGHRNTTAIVLLNVFLGWTFLGWVVALVWSVLHGQGQAPQPTADTPD